MLRWGFADDGQRAVGLASSSPVGPAEVRLLALAGVIPRVAQWPWSSPGYCLELISRSEALQRWLKGVWSGLVSS